jgi:hypothetical protein
MTSEAVTYFKRLGWRVYDNGTEREWLEDKYNGGQYGWGKSRGRKVTPKKGETYFRLWDGSTCVGIYNGRELYSFYLAVKKDHGAISKAVKATKGKSRTALRDAIKRGDFDKIPQRGVLKPDDRWNYD